jgi:hypothetical protein
MIGLAAFILLVILKLAGGSNDNKNTLELQPIQKQMI